MGSHFYRGNIDRPILYALKDRLQTSAIISQTTIEPKRGKATLIGRFNTKFFPSEVEEAYYNIHWYTSDDFSFHYQENWTDDNWRRRWDRHSHHLPGFEEHYHPPPNAGTPDQMNHPHIHFDVLSIVYRKTYDHIQNHPLI